VGSQVRRGSLGGSRVRKRKGSEKVYATERGLMNGAKTVLSDDCSKVLGGKGKDKKRLRGPQGCGSA